MKTDAHPGFREKVHLNDKGCVGGIKFKEGKQPYPFPPLHPPMFYEMVNTKYHNHAPCFKGSTFVIFRGDALCIQILS